MPNERQVPVPIEEEMRKSYLAYAMSVIVGRALPDIRDGLKPVHRRGVHPLQELRARPAPAPKKGGAGARGGAREEHPPPHPPPPRAAGPGGPGVFPPLSA